MTKANITQYDSTPSNNADINDINIAENCPASNINNAIRELMAHLKNVDTGSQALTALSVTGALSCGAFTSNGIDDNADATAITITSSEDVGIGTTTPTGTGWSSSAKTLQISQDSTSGALLRVTSSNTDGVVGAFNNAMQIATIGEDPIQFYTNSSERMRIDSGGDVFVGASSFSSGAKGKQFEINNNAIALRSGSALTTTQFHEEFHNPNGTVGTISTFGSSTNFNTSSDYRLKENVTYIFDATSRLKQLKPSRFNFKADADTTVDGFLAHEVSSIVPEAVTGEKDAVDSDGNIVAQSIDQSKLVPLLTKALQEQQATIEALTARITALENA